MTKEKLTKEQLEQQKQSLEREIVALESAVTASDSHAFDLLIADIKQDMADDIAEENWKSLKINQKKIESYREVENIIASQADLLEAKREELADVVYDLEHYQMTMDDLAAQMTSSENTNIYVKDHGEVATGAVFSGYVFEKIEDGKGEHIPAYYLVKKSAEVDGKYAILSNTQEGEMLLNYPANKKLLDEADEYVGNIYDENDNQEEALEYAKIIADYQEQFNQPNCADEESDS